MFKKLGILGLILSSLIYAQEPKVDRSNKASLQRGAKLYMNYCSGCHSLKYIRYNRIDKDLLQSNLIFTQASNNDPIRIALPPEDATQWFGVVPPDLSLISKQRGPLWLYQYLKSFYSDNSRPFGANNLLVPGVAMPNILEPLIGEVILAPNNADHLALVKAGELTEVQFNQLVHDLVSFLVYVGEPEYATRYRLGIFVLSFLLVFGACCFLLINSVQNKKSIRTLA